MIRVGRRFVVSLVAVGLLAVPGLPGIALASYVAPAPASRALVAGISGELDHPRPQRRLTSSHPAGLQTLGTAPVCNSAWNSVATPNAAGDNFFSNNAVAAISPTDVWGVGTSINNSLDQTLIEHWNGSAWVIVSSPDILVSGTATNNDLESVSANSSTDVWAAGAYFNGSVWAPLVEHYDGATWTATALAAAGSGDNFLFGIKAISGNDVWAVGYWRQNNLSATVRNTLALHWNGLTWSANDPPNDSAGAWSNTLFDVSASATNNVIAVGRVLTTGSGSNSYPIIEEWNGAAWTLVLPSEVNPYQILYGVTVQSSSLAWAVGFDQTSFGAAAQTMILRWDGTTWSRSLSPDIGGATNPNNELFSVTASAANDAWAVGAAYGTFNSSGQSATAQTLTEHWDGSVWSSVPSADASTWDELNGVGAPSGSDVWVVGDFFNIANVDQTLAENWCLPVQTPGAPTNVSATGGNASATVSWTAPASNGGSPITAYVITPYIGSTAQTATTVTGSPPPTTTVISGLTNGTTYTFKVAAQNSAGLGAQSTASNAVTPATVPGAPTQVNALPGDIEATVTWMPPASNGGGGVTSYVVVASPGGATTTVSAVTPAATITGLTNGTPYTFTVAAINAVGTGAASGPSAAVTPVAVAKGAAVAVLPAVTSGAYGGYLTVAYLENFNPTPAHIRVQYFDTNGNPVGTGNSAAGLPFWGTWTLRQDNADALGAGQAGSAVVYSDQPLAIFVNEFAPGNVGDATSYTSVKLPAGAGRTIYAPAIANGAYGGYTTGIGLINTGSAATDVRITYRDTTGTAVKVQNLTAVAANAYQGLYSGDAALGLPAGFAGTATIESTSLPAQPLAAVINEVGPGGQFSSYDAVPAGATTVHAPVALNNAFGGYFTGMAIQNTGTTAGTVTLTYYDGSGTLVKTVSNQAITASGYLGVYQGDPTLGPPPSASGYTAVLSSTVPIAAIVNEVAPSSTSAKQSTAYNTFDSGSVALNLPLVESAGSDGWSTGEGIMNTGTAATTVTVTYFDAATGALVGTPQSITLQPNAFWGLYQPAGGLPSGTRASAQVTTTGQPVAVICNESNATTFMSYGGQ